MQESHLDPSYPPTLFYISLDGLLLTCFAHVSIYFHIDYLQSFPRKGMKGEGEDSILCTTWTSETHCPKQTP